MYTRYKLIWELLEYSATNTYFEAQLIIGCHQSRCDHTPLPHYQSPAKQEFLLASRLSLALCLSRDGICKSSLRFIRISQPAYYTVLLLSLALRGRARSQQCLHAVRFSVEGFAFLLRVPKGHNKKTFYFDDQLLEGTILIGNSRELTCSL
jgi:hypothetical protein